MRPILLTLLGWLALAVPAYAAESVYTPLDLDHCKTLSEDDGGVVLSCKGFRNYPVLYKEGDTRPSVFFGQVPKPVADSGWETFAPFASVGKTVEWRVKGKVPYAAILRFYLSDPEFNGTNASREKKGQVLVISKVATEEDPEACVIGMVDALENGDANGIARDLADETAADFTCGTDEATYRGKKGRLAGSFSSSLPDE